MTKKREARTPPEHLTLSPHRWLGGEAELGWQRCVWEASPEGAELAGRPWGSVLTFRSGARSWGQR